MLLLVRNDKNYCCTVNQRILRLIQLIMRVNYQNISLSSLKNQLELPINWNITMNLEVCHWSVMCSHVGYYYDLSLDIILLHMLSTLGEIRFSNNFFNMCGWLDYAMKLLTINNNKSLQILFCSATKSVYQIFIFSIFAVAGQSRTIY
jgi:hypothetical protein